MFAICLTLDKSTKLVKFQFFILKVGMILKPGFSGFGGKLNKFIHVKYLALKKCFFSGWDLYLTLILAVWCPDPEPQLRSEGPLTFGCAPLRWNACLPGHLHAVPLTSHAPPSPGFPRPSCPVVLRWRLFSGSPEALTFFSSAAWLNSASTSMAGPASKHSKSPTPGCVLRIQAIGSFILATFLRILCDIMYTGLFFPLCSNMLA